MTHLKIFINAYIRKLCNTLNIHIGEIWNVKTFSSDREGNRLNKLNKISSSQLVVVHENLSTDYRYDKKEV